MKKTSLAAAVAFALAAGQGIAENYQMEGGLSYADFDGDDSNIGLDFTYHLDMVNTGGHPLAEAGFLERSSNIGISYATWDEADLTELNLQGEFYTGDLYFAGGLDRTDNGDDANNINLRLGYMLQDGFRVHVGADLNDNDDDTTDLNLGLKYVSKLGGDSAFNVEAEVTQLDNADDTLLYGLQADYYLNNSASVGLRFADSDVSGLDATMGLGAKFFFTPLMSVEGEYMTNDDLGDEFNVRFAMRF